MLKKCESHFFSKKYQHICVSLNVNFNESLTNDIFSFWTTGPCVFVYDGCLLNVGIYTPTLLLTLVLLNPDIPCLCKQCRSRSVGFKEANLSGSTLFAIQYVNLYQLIWYAENLKRALHLNLFSRRRVEWSKKYGNCLIQVTFMTSLTVSWRLFIPCVYREIPDQVVHQQKSWNTVWLGFRLYDSLHLKKLFMSVSWLTGVQVVVFLCYCTLVLFDNLGISQCLNTLFLLTTQLCFIIGFICVLSVAHNDSRLSWKTSTQTK